MGKSDQEGPIIGENKMSFLKRIILPMALLLLFSMAFMSFAVARYVASQKKPTDVSKSDTSEKKSISNLTNINPGDYDSIVKNEFALANLKAKESNQGNELSAIDIEIAADLMPSSVISRYVFSSDTDPNNNWTMTFSEINTDFTRALIPKDDYLGNVLKINTKLWKFNFVTALQLAEKNGGLSWRESNTLKDIRLTLRHTEPKNWLLWLVQYKADNSSLLIKIDANSGRIVTDEDTPNSI